MNTSTSVLIVGGSLNGLTLAMLTAIAAGWPDTAWGPAGPFGERVDVPATAPACQRLMGFLGRRPGWTAALA